MQRRRGRAWSALENGDCLADCWCSSQLYFVPLFADSGTRRSCSSREPREGFFSKRSFVAAPRNSEREPHFKSTAAATYMCKQLSCSIVLNQNAGPPYSQNAFSLCTPRFALSAAHSALLLSNFFNYYGGKRLHRKLRLFAASKFEDLMHLWYFFQTRIASWCSPNRVH